MQKASFCFSVQWLRKHHLATEIRLEVKKLCYCFLNDAKSKLSAEKWYTQGPKTQVCSLDGCGFLLFFC